MLVDVLRPTHVPSGSIVSVMASGRRNMMGDSDRMVLEPGNAPLPGGLMVVPMFTSIREC